MREEFDRARHEVLAEQARLEPGLDAARSRPRVARSFRLMNRAIAYSSQGRGYDSWRPFQVGFLLGALPFLTDRDTESTIVDTVWFATGGGKTETYLGLLVTTAFHDRLTGKTTGVTAWSRFPLRLLSLQQTQRFADALAGAERVRREEEIRGAPFSLGFLVGKGGTPNKVVKDATDDHPDPDSPGMPDKYQVLLRCPFCHGGPDRDAVRPPLLAARAPVRQRRRAHGPNGTCPSTSSTRRSTGSCRPSCSAPSTRPPPSACRQPCAGSSARRSGLCTEPSCTATPTPSGPTRPNGCLVPDCPATRQPLPMPRERFAPSLRLQDELHLLRDSLGAVDSHYESLLDHLQETLGGPPAKVVASSATLNGHDRQVDVLYRRTGRVFPQPGPTAGDSFWTRRTGDALRRFVAVAPRGVTLEHVTDRTIERPAAERAASSSTTRPHVCAEAGVDPVHAELLLEPVRHRRRLRQHAARSRGRRTQPRQQQRLSASQQRPTHRADRLRRRPRDPRPA